MFENYKPFLFDVFNLCSKFSALTHLRVQSRGADSRFLCVFSLTGQTEEPQNSLSSPILDTPLDSPLSCADLTLDTTGDITVEDVREFLT